MIRKHPWIIAVAGTALLIIWCAVLYIGRQTIQQRAMSEAVDALKQVMENTDQRMHQIEAAADSLIPQIEQHLDQPDMMFDFSRQMLRDAPDAKGCSISFDPYFFKEKGKYFSAYSYNNGDSITTEQEGSEDYQYNCMDWYLIPHLLYHSYWVEPFAEPNPNGGPGNIIMTSYCQPIQGGPDQTVGILSVDVPLTWLGQQLNGYHPKSESYCMLVGLGGTYIVHPDSTRLLYETIFTPTLEKPDTALTSLGRAMTSGETGYKSLMLDSVASHVFYMPFRQTGWSIALVCPDEVILGKYYTLFYLLLPLILLSVMLMFMPIWRHLYRRRNYAAAFLPLLVFTVVTSCQKKDADGQPQPSAKETTANKVRQALADREGEQWFKTLDSLEHEGDIATCQADYLRGRHYDDIDQQRSALMFYKKALETNKLAAIDKGQYYHAYKRVSSIHLNSNNIEMSLDAATKGYDIASKDTTIVGRDNTNNFLLNIGLCQLRLNHIGEAAKTFEQARQGAETLALNNPYSPSCQQSSLLIASNIANYYMNLDMFDQVTPWIDMMERALERYAANDVPMQNYAGYLAILNCNKAIMWGKTGHADEAEAAYQSFLASDYAKTLQGVYDQAYYLQTTEQWEKLLAITLRIDSVENASGIQPTLDYLINSPATIFTAMLKTGRKEQALQEAEQIISLLDSVRQYQHQSDADELAVIYETEQKEAQIAEQRNTLNQQRMIGTAVIVLLLVIFLGVLFEFYRRLRHAHALLEVSYNNLVIANAKAEESSKMKTNFIRQISHEIRTPLNILSGFTQVITTPDMAIDDDTRKDINQKIVNNTNRITGLVNKMLELSDANSQTVIERKDQVSAVQIAAQAADGSGICQASHVIFDLKSSEKEEQVILTTNEQAATRALTMLLDNACKFTRPALAASEAEVPKQHVTLSISLNDHSVLFTVEDTGIGVPAEEAEHIFEEFVQLDEYYDGTGIGLPVARSLARRLGGDITLDTSYTNGACFVMSLPLT